MKARLFLPLLLACLAPAVALADSNIWQLPVVRAVPDPYTDDYVPVGSATAYAGTGVGTGRLLVSAFDTPSSVTSWTNKTFDTAASGNVFKVNGNAISAVTGTGSTVALGNNPIFTGALTVNNNVGAAPGLAGLSGVLGAEWVGTDGSQQTIVYDTFGAQTKLYFRSTSGTDASGTATVSGMGLGSLNWVGYYVTGGPAYAPPSVTVVGIAEDNYTSTTRGAGLAFFTTTPGTASTFQKFRLYGDGAIVGSGTAVPADPGSPLMLMDMPYAVVTNTERALTNQNLTPATVTVTEVAGVANINFQAGQMFDLVLNAPCTITFSGVVDAQTVVITIHNSSTYTVTWPSMKWPGGSSPTMTTGAHFDVYTIYYNSVYGQYIGSYVQSYTN